jgi:hypothetical protein
MNRSWAALVVLAASSLASSQLSGHVFVEDQSCPAAHLTVRLSPPKSSSQSVIVTATGDDGRFAVNAGGGDYYVEVEQFGRQIYGHVLNISNGSPLEIKLDASNTKAISCGKPAAASAEPTQDASNNIYRLESHDTTDWRLIDGSFDASTGLVVLDQYGRVTRVSHSPNGYSGEVMFELPRSYTPNAIATGAGTIFVITTSAVGCNVFRYVVSSKRLDNRLARNGGEICTGIAADGASVYIAFANLQQVTYWENWESGSGVSIPISFSVYGAVLAADRQSHKVLLGDADGNLFRIDPSNRSAAKAASFGIPPNAIGISSQDAIVVSGGKLISFSRSDLQKNKTPNALARMPPGRYVGIAIDSSDEAWILDGQHDIIRGPISLQ